LDESDRYVERFIELAEYYQFDGWFFNLESNLPNKEYVDKMIQFLKNLTKKIHERIPGSLVLWYDSVISPNGEVKWQNELNEKNKQVSLFLWFHSSSLTLVMEYS
jgi:mannosyl-glycoprotein endo-beta-N-acetylglucosaminidase